MLNRILEISEENRYISLSRGFVVVKQDNVELGKIPIDDISVLLTYVVMDNFLKENGHEGYYEYKVLNIIEGIDE